VKGKTASEKKGGGGGTPKNPPKASRRTIFQMIVDGRRVKLGGVRLGEVKFPARIPTELVGKGKIHAEKSRGWRPVVKAKARSAEKKGHPGGGKYVFGAEIPSGRRTGGRWAYVRMRGEGRSTRGVLWVAGKWARWGQGVSSKPRPLNIRRVGRVQ